MAALLEVSDLRVQLAGAAGSVLNGISFSLERGQTLGLVGQSGSGKSMTALAIMGLLPPGARVSGRVRLDGVDLLSAGEANLRRVRGRRIGIVFQEPGASLNPTLAVGEQIAETLRLHLGFSAAAARERCAKLMEEVGLTDARRRMRRFSHELSGGMQQRVMIAMAIACGPQVLIADEPTTALDVTTQAQVLGLLAELQKRRDLAILFITHDLALLAEFARTLCVIHDGVVVDQGPVVSTLMAARHAHTRRLLESALALEGSAETYPGSGHSSL